ncbi:retrovirus-related pol polyprotein from transposon TNT 1-94 [Tanacetum coccineum]
MIRISKIRFQKRQLELETGKFCLNVNDRSCEPYNANDVTDLLEQNEHFRAEIEKVKQHYKELFESIKITRTSTNAKTSSFFNERDNKAPSTPVTRKKQVTFNDKPGTSSSNTQKHEVHQKVQQTNVPVIHSTGVNTSTEASGSKPRSNTKKNRILPAKTKNKKKVEDHPRTNKSVWTKVNRVDSSISSKRVVINSNSESVCKTCNKCLNSASHEMCVVNILNSMNATPTVKIVLNKGKQIWKPSKLVVNSMTQDQSRLECNGQKIFANVGYQMESTGYKVALENLIVWESCSKLKNFVEKFIGTVRFGNDHFGAIMGYGDYVIGDSVISRVYYVEGLGHNLFSVGQFCDSDLEVAFRKHSCFVCDINGADLLKGSRSTNLYTISIDDMMKSSPICLLSKASKSKSWLWHRRLNHLNFGTINDLARKDLVILEASTKMKFKKDHLCSAVNLEKMQEVLHKPNLKTKIWKFFIPFTWICVVHMRSRVLMERNTFLVIVMDYSRFTLDSTVQAFKRFNHQVTKFSGDEIKAVGLYQMKRLINKNWKHITVTWQRFRRSHLKNPVLLVSHWNREGCDSNVIPDSSNICTNDNQVDQNAAECVDERAALANLIANLTLDTEENKTVLKQLKKANASLTQELKECKTNLDETSRALGEATSSRDSCLIALQTKQTELEKTICEQAWSNHTNSAFPNPTAKSMEVLIKTLLMPLSDKTILDSHCFVHELKTEMHDDLEYVKSLEKEVDELESEKADFSNIYDLLLEECVSKDVICSYLHSLSDLNAHTGLQCLYLHKVKECECLAQKLSKQTESVNKEVHNNLLKSFSKLEKHSISLELALQQCKEQMKNNSVCKENASNVFRKEREQYHEIQDLKAQMQDKNIAISELKKLIENCKGKSVETQFNKPSVVRQPNAQRIPKPSVLGKPTPFSNSPEMRSFQTKQSVNKTNVSDGLFKQVTQQNLPQIRKQAVRNTNVIAPGPSRNNPKHVSFQSPKEFVGSNDMVHNYYLEKAKKSAQLQKDKEVNGKPSMIDPARLPNTANGCKPKPRNWQASMSSRVSNKDVHLGEHRKQKPFLKFNDLQCPTCKKCLYSANHDECVLEYLSRLNPRASAQNKDAKSHKTTKRYMPVEKSSASKKPERQIPTGHRFSNKKTTTVPEKTMNPRSCLRWKPTGRIFSNVRLRWIPTGKLLNSCTGKVDSEPAHGSIVDIPHIHACKQTLGLSAGTSFNGQKQQRIDLNADALYNEKQENLRVWPRSSMFKRRLIAADQASVFMAMTFEQRSSSLVLHQMMSDHNSSDLAPQRQEISIMLFPTAEKTDSSHQGLEFLFSPLLEEYYNPTHGQAEENNNDQAPNASFQEAEFINPFCTRVQEIGESSSRNIDNTDVHSFQPQSHDYRWTRDHPLEQVRGNPTMPVQTRRSLHDPEMCMFALTDELHQFDRLKVWELVDKPFGKMVIKLNWLWKNKKDEDQTIIRNQRRLVAKWLCRKKVGYDFEESIWHQFAAWKQKEVLLLHNRRGSVDPDHPEKVYLLRKALYGLKQAPSPIYVDDIIFGSTNLNIQTIGKVNAQLDLKCGCLDTRKRTSGGISSLVIKLVSWMSRHKTALHVFWTEAETEYQLTDMFTKALLEDRFKYLVRRIGMRCLTPAELEVVRLGINPMIQPEPEDLPKDNPKLEIAVLRTSEVYYKYHNEDGNLLGVNIKHALVGDLRVLYESNL